MCLGLVVLLAAPFVLVEVPPVVDYPNHLARYYLLSHPHDEVLSRFYAPHWDVLPNIGMDLIGTGLLKIMPVHVAGRLLLALALFAPVAGSVIYSRAQFRRFTAWSLAAALVATNFAFFMGFMNFLLGVGVALAGAGVWIMASRRNRRLALAVGAISSVLVFFCHLSVLPFFAVLVGAYEAERLLGPWLRRPAGARLRDDTWRDGAWRRDAVISASMLTLAVLPALALYALSPAARVAGGVIYRPFGEKLLQLLLPFVAYSLPLAVVTAATVACLFAVQGWRVGRGVPLALGLLAIVFVATPGWMKGGAFVDTRLPIMASFLLFAGFAPTLSRRAAIWVAITIAVLSGVRTIEVATVWRAHAVKIAQLRSVIAGVPAGAKVLAVCRGRRDSVAEDDGADCNGAGLYGQMAQHLPALLVIERRAFWPLQFADPRQQPMRVRPPYDQIATPLGEMVDVRRLVAAQLSPRVLRRQPYLARWRREFDYLLVINVTAKAMPDDAGLGTGTGLELVAARPIASLYRVRPDVSR